MGRFLLDIRIAEDGVDASRDCDCAGVRSRAIFVGPGSCLTTGMPGSLISIKSSSSSDAGVIPPNFVVSESVRLDHTPSGSTVTWSMSGDVDCRMSSTYLYDLLGRETDMSRGYGLTGRLGEIRS
jgi:hypothetical protein